MTSLPGVNPIEHAHAEHQREMGDLLVAYLAQLRVEYVFGVPGGAIEPLYNALARSARHGGPRAVGARHETDAAFMADGYARHSGRLGVCCATTGPGATNLITGVSSAYANHVPMLVITAQTALANFGRGALQESSCTAVNTVGMFEYCTRYSTLISHPDQFEFKLATAIMTAFRSPVGPTHLSIPLDVMRSPAPGSRIAYDLATLVHKPSLTDDDAVYKLCQELSNAQRVVFVVGDGCSEGIGSILDAALLLNAKILTTPHGKGLVSPYHPLFRGVVGLSGHASALDLLTDPDVDVVVAIGTGLSETASNCWDASLLLNSRLIHVDASEENFTRSPMARLHVRGRIVTIFDKVLSHLYTVRLGKAGSAGSGTALQPVARDSEQNPKRYFDLDEEEKCHQDATPIKPQRLMRELTRMFPPNTRYLADSGNGFAWAIHYLHPFDRRMAGRRDAKGGIFRTGLEYASMGWAIGAAIGTALACPGSPVVCLTGDGSYLMAGQELTAAIQEQLPVVFVVLNDSAYGMVKHGQRLAGAEPVAYELPRTDFAAMAAAMGAASHVIRSPQDLLALDVAAMCGRDGPTLLDVRVDPEEVPPISTRMKALGTGC